MFVATVIIIVINPISLIGHVGPGMGAEHTWAAGSGFQKIDLMESIKRERS